MALGSADAVVQNLEEAGATTHRVSPASFTETVAEVVEPPAVGVLLEGCSVSLDGTPVSVDPTPAELRQAATGVTPASLCVAEYGTVVLPDRDDGSELVSLFVEKHVVVLHETDVVPDMDTAFDWFGRDPDEARRSRILATGPSATADMGALVEGAHGPKDVTVLVVSEA